MRDWLTVLNPPAILLETLRENHIMTMTDQTIDLSWITSDRDFYQLIHFEFSQCETAEQAHSTYKDYRDLGETNSTFNRLLALREEYSYALDRLTDRPQVKKTEEVGQPPINEAPVEPTEEVEAPQPKTNRDVFSYWKGKLGNPKYCPIPQNINELSDLDAYRILCFQLARTLDKAELPSHNDVLLFTCSIETVEQAQEYLNELSNRK